MSSESTTTESIPAAVPVPVPAKKKGSFSNPYIWGTGRRKTAVARVRIRPGKGMFVVNGREADKFFTVDFHRQLARRPLSVTDESKSLDVFVNVGGGGITGQAAAISLGLARALIKSNPDFLPKLREADLLTRDAREVERKKYGRAGARRRFQFSKR